MGNEGKFNRRKKTSTRCLVDLHGRNSFDGGVVPISKSYHTPYTIIKHLSTVHMCMYVSIRGCAMCFKLLQREPCKAALNSKDESGMGRANFYKSLTINRIAMLWAIWAFRTPKGKIPKPVLTGKGTLCHEKRNRQPKARLL